MIYPEASYLDHYSVGTENGFEILQRVNSKVSEILAPVLERSFDWYIEKTKDGYLLTVNVASKYIPMAHNAIQAIEETRHTFQENENITISFWYSR